MVPVWNRDRYARLSHHRRHPRSHGTHDGTTQEPGAGRRNDATIVEDRHERLDHYNPNYQDPIGSFAVGCNIALSNA